MVCALMLSGCNAEHGIFGPAGPVAQEQQDLFLFILFWMLVVSLPLFIALPVILYRYRHGARSSAYLPKWSFSRSLEVLVWGLPAVVVVILSWELWRATYDLDPYKPIASSERPLEIDVVGLDWKWLFIYPEEGIASVNLLVVPVDRPIRFRLTSGTVLQSFMIPRLGGQIYAMPGMVTELNLLAAEPGDYRGLNTQYNGDGFARQKFTARVTSQAMYDDWISGLKQTSPALDPQVLEELTQQNVPDDPMTFGSVTVTDPFVGFANAQSHRHPPASPHHTVRKEAP